MYVFKSNDQFKSYKKILSLSLTVQQKIKSNIDLLKARTNS